MWLLILSFYYLLFIGSVNSFEDIEDLKIECKKTKGYPETIIEKECIEPVIYEFPRINRDKLNYQKDVQPFPPVCLSIAEWTRDFTSYQNESRAQNKLPSPLFLLHMVNGLLRIQQELKVEYSTALTSPFELVRKYDPNDPDLKLYSEVSIDGEMIKEIIVDNYFNVVDVLHIFLPELSLWHDSIENTSRQKMNILVYYDSNLTFIPSTKNIVHEDSDPRRYHPCYKKDKRSIENIVVNASLKYYRNYQRLVNMRNSEPPWVDDYHRSSDKLSLWCRGHRFIMAIFNPIVRWETLKKNGKDTEWRQDNTLNGPRYCSVTIINETIVFVQMFLSQEFKKNEEKPSTYAIQVCLERTDANDWFIPKYSVLRLAFKNPPGSDRYGYEKKASVEYEFEMEMTRSKTHYSVGSLVYVNNDFNQLREEVEIERLAIEFNLNGVPEKFSEEYTTVSRLFALGSSSLAAESRKLASSRSLASWFPSSVARRLASSRWLATESSLPIEESRWIESSRSLASGSSLSIAESRKIASFRWLATESSLVVAESRRIASARSLASGISLSIAESRRIALRLGLERLSRSMATESSLSIAESRKVASSRLLASESSMSVAESRWLASSQSFVVGSSREFMSKSSSVVEKSRFLVSSQSLASGSSLSIAKSRRDSSYREFMSKSSSVVRKSRWLASSRSLALGSFSPVTESLRVASFRSLARRSSLSVGQSRRARVTVRPRVTILCTRKHGAASLRTVRRGGSKKSEKFALRFLRTTTPRIASVQTLATCISKSLSPVGKPPYILRSGKLDDKQLSQKIRSSSSSIVIESRKLASQSFTSMTSGKLDSKQFSQKFRSSSSSIVKESRKLASQSFTSMTSGKLDRKQLSRKFRSSSSSIVKESRKLASQSFALMMSSRNVAIDEMQQKVAASKSKARHLEQQQFIQRSKARMAEVAMRRERFKSNFDATKAWLVPFLILGGMLALAGTLIHILRSKMKNQSSNDRTGRKGGMRNRRQSKYGGGIGVGGVGGVGGAGADVPRPLIDRFYAMLSYIRSRSGDILVYIAQSVAILAAFNIMCRLKDCFIDRRRRWCA